jgi:CubicO group peptidase (beta-lactamase class C family)
LVVSDSAGRDVISISEWDSVPIGGTVVPGFEPVVEAFRRNFTDRNELGAAVAAFRGSECLVDLWGGWKDTDKTQPWVEDTMVLVFSTTKGMSAVAMAVAMSRGLLSVHDRVALRWPEFASKGKAEITVGGLLAHQAGIPVIDTPLTPDLLANHDRLAHAIAGQAPLWEPGARHGYHALGLGFYQSELIRRTDPGGRTVGRFFAEEVAAPLGVEFYIGLPSEVDSERVAPIDGFHPLQMALHLNTLPAGMVLAYLWPRSTTNRTMSNPKVRTPADFDRPQWREVEFPSAGGIGQVRAVARIYAELAASGSRLGVTPEVLRTLEQPFAAPTEGRRDVVLKVDMTYAGGFAKPPSFEFGTDGRAYGTMGAGGSFGFADPATGVGFCYAGNRMGFHLWDDPRERSLRHAVFKCLAATDNPAGTEPS